MNIRDAFHWSTGNCEARLPTAMTGTVRGWEPPKDGGIPKRSTPVEGHSEGRNCDPI